MKNPSLHTTWTCHKHNYRCGYNSIFKKLEKRISIILTTFYENTTHYHNTNSTRLNRHEQSQAILLVYKPYVFIFFLIICEIPLQHTAIRAKTHKTFTEMFCKCSAFLTWPRVYTVSCVFAKHNTAIDLLCRTLTDTLD